MSQAQEEIRKGKRFAFGKNWSNFLRTLNADRIREAENDLKDMLDIETLNGMRFLDIGSGSGLSSLAAKRLGAKVFSFDFDQMSVACTKELKKRFFPDDADWTVQEGSALNEDFIRALGTFDIVYSWGVLHHTGNMWNALENAMIPVKKEKGILFIALYNDQGIISSFWTAVKKFYCSGLPGKVICAGVFFPYFFLSGLALDLIKRKNPVKRYADYKKKRGMSIMHDWFDWLGGYPFEVAKPEKITAYFERQGFTLKRIKTTNRLGNNQFVFEKTS